MLEEKILFSLVIFAVVIRAEVLALAILLATALARGPKRMQGVLKLFFVLGLLTSLLAAGFWLLLPRLGISLYVGPSPVLWFIALLVFTGAAGFLCWGVAGRVVSAALICSAVGCVFRFLIHPQLK